MTSRSCSISTILVFLVSRAFCFALYYAHEFHSKTRRSGAREQGLIFMARKVRPTWTSCTYRWS